MALDFILVSKSEGVYQVSGYLGYGGCVVPVASGNQRRGREGKGGCKGIGEGGHKHIRGNTRGIRARSRATAGSVEREN